MPKFIPLGRLFAMKILYHHTEQLTSLESWVKEDCLGLNLEGHYIKLDPIENRPSSNNKK